MHPDHNPGDAVAEAKFKEIGEAYAVLSDVEQRGQYDQLRAMAGGARFTAGGRGGTAGFDDVFGAMFGGGGGAAGGGPRVRYSTPGAGGAGGAAGFEDLLGGLFGGGGGSYGGRGAQQGGDLAATTTLPFRQAATGVDRAAAASRGGRSPPASPRGCATGRRSGCAARAARVSGGAPAATSW